MLFIMKQNLPRNQQPLNITSVTCTVAAPKQNKTKNIVCLSSPVTLKFTTQYPVTVFFTTTLEIQSLHAISLLSLKIIS